MTTNYLRGEKKRKKDQLEIINKKKQVKKQVCTAFVDGQHFRALLIRQNKGR